VRKHGPPEQVAEYKHRYLALSSSVQKCYSATVERRVAQA